MPSNVAPGVDLGNIEVSYIAIPIGIFDVYFMISSFTGSSICVQFEDLAVTVRKKSHRYSHLHRRVLSEKS